jgi:hypothetical protein
LSQIRNFWIYTFALFSVPLFLRGPSPGNEQRLSFGWSWWVWLLMKWWTSWLPVGFLHIPPKRVHRFGGICKNPIYAREVLAQESSVKESAAEKSKVRQVQIRLTEAEAQVQTLQKQIKHLQAERAEWVAWKEAEIVLYTQLTAMQQYLQEHPGVAIPIVRNGVTIKIVTLSNDSLAVSEDHGLVRLSDDELEQGRVFVARKTGMPVIATRQAIGAKCDEGA